MWKHCGIAVLLGITACAGEGQDPRPPVDMPAAALGQVAAAATSSPQNVNIVGATATVPVAAQGTTQVAGTVTVANPVTSVSATQSGSWNVNVPNPVSVGNTVAVSPAGGSMSVNVANSVVPVSIASLPSVSVSSMPSLNIATMPGITIANTPASPAITRSADEHARQPFQMDIVYFGANQQNDFDVPAGKRLVIECTTADFIIDGGTYPLAYFNASYNGTAIGRVIETTKKLTIQGGNNTTFDEYTGSTRILAYVDGGTTLQVHAPPANYFAGTLSLVGYFIDQ